MKHSSQHYKQRLKEAKRKAQLKNEALQKMRNRNSPKLGATGTARKKKLRNSGLIAAGMLLVILLIPTLVVVPFSFGDASVGNLEAGLKKQQKETGKSEVKEPESAFSVAVMRTASEQVENVPLETYVTRVVASEMPADFEMEALKAQSLAARTYIVNHLLSNSNKGGAQVTDTVQHQVYKNDTELRKVWGSEYDNKMKKLKKAVASTAGQILTYHKEPITPSFFSTSNGYTENSEDYWGQKLPYLRSVKSPWDQKSPKFQDQQVFTRTQVGNALGIDLSGGTAAAFEVTRTESGRVAEVKLGSSKFSGKKIRELLGLPSSDFKIEQKNDHFIFKTKGYGHGVGMSQYGANGMAKEGKDYKQIVKHYYQGIEIRPVEEAATKLVSR
ncbi:stage II sporulation protein D [Aciduricibacillus chroicocephali]|uniref:Stage II sporulation protein D n=1 Tax=Aciduricibacillus chroicocephali TaxID=3054939 RepID=A0ABY9KTT1_9BACI|nr:stage II sporulation protein D [Bacillaceae bacterium 44XB]